MRHVFTFIFLLTSFGLFAQREAANWYFGNLAGLDFNSGNPTLLFDGQIRTVEGCETFSDADGNLLFYTEGNTVWNRFHEIMPNGTDLGGSVSSTQAALVVPNPSLENIYYIFTPDDARLFENGGTEGVGFNYAILDINLDSGRGDIISKNMELLEAASEKVTAVRSPNGDFFWVITHFVDRFYAYRVDAGGVNPNPVITTIGPRIESQRNIRGALKVSPDGTKLVIAHTILEPSLESGLYLFNFNAETGRVSNTQNISDNRLYYGVEFSSNSSKLYASGLVIRNGDDNPFGNLDIVQFDLDNPDLRASQFLVNSFTRPSQLGGVQVAGALQLAIDGKIYHASQGPALSVIRTPNSLGLDSDFRAFALDLGSRSSTFGLPPFIQSLFESIVTIENFCEGDETVFTVESDNEITGVNWDFGDPASGAANFSTAINPTHIFSAAGTYTVNLEVNFANGPTRDFIEFVEIAEVPDVDRQVVLFQCDGDAEDDGITLFNLNEAIPLFTDNPDVGGRFFRTEEDAIANVNALEPLGYQNQQNGELIYARLFENSACFAIGELILDVAPASNLGAIAIQPICLDRPESLADVVEVQPSVDFLNEIFSNGEQITLYRTQNDALLETNSIEAEENQTFSFLDEREFYFRLEEEDLSCGGIGRLELNFISPPEFENTITTEICMEIATLEAPPNFESYLWSTGETTQMITVTQTGTFDVVFSSESCDYTQTFEVEESTTNSIEDISIVDFSRNNTISIVLANQEPNVRYSIDGGITFQTSNQFGNLTPGVYDILVATRCLELTETVLVGGLDSFFTPNGDNTNEVWTLANQEFFPNFNIAIFDRYGQLLYRFGEGDSGWDGTFNQRRLPSASYWYRIETEGRTVNGFFALRR